MGDYTSWRGWFESRFGESLEDFADRAKRERFGEQIRNEHEAAQA